MSYTRYMEHGTERGYQKHWRATRGTDRRVECRPCLDAHSRHVGARRGPDWKPRALKPCGTPPAYHRHLYHGEVPCRPCTDAHTAANRRNSHRVATEKAVQLAPRAAV